MRIRKIMPVVVATAVALAITVSSSPAQAAPAVGSTPISVSAATSSSLLVELHGLKNQKSGKFLQPSGGSTASYTKLVQENFTGTSVQAWSAVASTGGYNTFTNYAASKRMGIDGASTAAGASAIIAPGDGASNQDWQIIQVSGSTVWFHLKNRKSLKCLGISGASTAVHAPAQQFACDNTTNQTWSFTS